MSIADALARINQIQAMAAPPAAAAPAAAQTAAPDASQFASKLGAQMPAGPAPEGTGGRIVALARAELARGVHETGGNNDSPDIARYRTATRGAAAGAPWCAYFVSYICRQAGVPIGPGGAGMGYVPAITDWARQTGKFVPPSGQVRPGDLILFGGAGHIGIVESVNADGSLTTIEGNHSDRVDRVQRSKSEAVGFVHLG